MYTRTVTEEREPHMLLLYALAAGFASGIVELDENSYESHTRQPDKYNVVMFYNTGALFILLTAFA